MSLNFLLRSSQQGLPGIIDPTQVLCPVPGKRVINIEGFHVERRYLNVTINDPLITTVLNEIYLLEVYYNYTTGGSNSNNRVTYSLNFPPTVNDPVSIVTVVGGLAVRQNTIQTICLCSELTAETNLPGGADFYTLQAFGYKLFLQDI